MVQTAIIRIIIITKICSLSSVFGQSLTITPKSEVYCNKDTVDISFDSISDGVFINKLTRSQRISLTKDQFRAIQNYTILNPPGNSQRGLSEVSILNSGDSLVGVIVQLYNRTLITFTLSKDLDSLVLLQHVDLARVLSEYPLAVELIEHEGEFIVFVNSMRNMIRLDFGNSLNSLPRITSIYNSDDYHWPHELQIVRSDNVYVGFCSNRNVSTQITRFIWRNGIYSVPEISNFKVRGLDNAVSVEIVFDQYSHDHYLICASLTDQIAKIRFHSLFDSTYYKKSIQQISNIPYTGLRGISIVKDCEGYSGFISTNYNYIYKFRQNLNLDSSIYIIDSVNFNNYFGWGSQFSFSHEPILYQGYVRYLFTKSNTPAMVILHTDSQLHVFQQKSIRTTVQSASRIKYSLRFLTPYQKDICNFIAGENCPRVDFNLSFDSDKCSNDSIETISYSVMGKYDSMTVYLENTRLLNIQNNSGFQISTAGNYKVLFYFKDSTLSKEFKFDRCKCNFHIPNAVTPGIDNLNDIFRITYDCDLSEMDMQIVNRWGQIIYQTKSLDPIWNSEQNEYPPTDGIYVYIIRYRLRNAGEFNTIKGLIHVIH